MDGHQRALVLGFTGRLSSVVVVQFIDIFETFLGPISGPTVRTEELVFGHFVEQDSCIRNETLDRLIVM